LATGAALAALPGFASCTTFDGLKASGTRDAAATEGGQPEAGEPDAGPLPPGYLSLQDAARACSWLFTCPKLDRSLIRTIAVPADASNFAVCMQWLAGPVDPTRLGLVTQRYVLACLASAESCAAAGACTAFEELALGDPRCAAEPDAGPAESCTQDGNILSCNPTWGNLLIHCDNSYFNRKGSCTQGADGYHYCAVDTSCPPVSCDGLFVLDVCMAGLHIRYDCSVSGQLCGEDTKTKGLSCVVGGLVEECTLAGARCQEDKVRVCDGIYVSYFDCAKLGGTCQEQAGYTNCVLPADTCTPADSAAVVCTGDAVTLCIGGKATTFDCASIGKKCQPPQAPRTAWCG
jgi:hypothetical protein